jgi:hypothetical protein
MTASGRAARCAPACQAEVQVDRLPKKRFIFCGCSIAPKVQCQATPLLPHQIPASLIFAIPCGKNVKGDLTPQRDPCGGASTCTSKARRIDPRCSRLPVSLDFDRDDDGALPTESVCRRGQRLVAVASPRRSQYCEDVRCAIAWFIMRSQQEIGTEPLSAPLPDSIQGWP